MSTKRNVSNATKRYVAADQKWRCKTCQDLLDASYEIDHIIPLWNQGTNHCSNLQALCANCHAKKTYLENLDRYSKPILRQHTQLNPKLQAPFKPPSKPSTAPPRLQPKQPPKQTKPTLKHLERFMHKFHLQHEILSRSMAQARKDWES